MAMAFPGRSVSSFTIYCGSGAQFSGTTTRSGACADVTIFGWNHSRSSRVSGSSWNLSSCARRRRSGDSVEKFVCNCEGVQPNRGLYVEVKKAKGLSYDGPARGGKWLSSTTRHVRIYIGVIDPISKKMDRTQLDKITLMLDPDNEFIWPDDKTQKVYDYFTELLDVYAGAPLTEYTLRLIGSDIEHFIRKLLLANEIKYNLNCRVLNFSMGKPQYVEGMTDV